MGMKRDEYETKIVQEWARMEKGKRLMDVDYGVVRLRAHKLPAGFDS